MPKDRASKELSALRKEVSLLATIYFPVAIMQYVIAANLASSEAGYTSLGPSLDVVISFSPNIACAIWLVVVSWKSAINTLALGVLGLGLGVHAVLIYLIYRSVYIVVQGVQVSDSL